MIRIVKAEVSDAGDNKLVRRCIFTSAYAFTGWVDDEVACIVGIISPTVLSNQAYLWLHCTPLVEQHKFLFVRYSQRWLEIALKEYPVITGMTRVLVDPLWDVPGQVCLQITDPMPATILGAIPEITVGDTGK